MTTLELWRTHKLAVLRKLKGETKLPGKCLAGQSETDRTEDKVRVQGQWERE